MDNPEKVMRQRYHAAEGRLPQQPTVKLFEVVQHRYNGMQHPTRSSSFFLGLGSPWRPHTDQPTMRSVAVVSRQSVGARTVHRRVRYRTPSGQRFCWLPISARSVAQLEPAFDHSATLEAELRTLDTTIPCLLTSPCVPNPGAFESASTWAPWAQAALQSERMSSFGLAFKPPVSSPQTRHHSCLLPHTEVHCLAREAVAQIEGTCTLTMTTRAPEQSSA